MYIITGIQLITDIHIINTRLFLGSHKIFRSLIVRVIVVLTQA